MSEATGVLLRDAEVIGFGIADVVLRDGLVAAIGQCELDAGEDFDCGRAALLPGLHDHHMHVLATAAAARSVQCGPPQVRSAADLASALAHVPAGADGWIRGIGYDESVAGALDASILDRLRPEVPVRVQHRSGALWVVNSIGRDLLGVDVETPAGVERDAGGVANGRLWRLDRWLGERLGHAQDLDLTVLSRRLASLGITGITDATPDLAPEARDLLNGGTLAQRLTLLGDRNGSAPYKIVVADHALPSWDELAARIRSLRPRAVAVHAVTRAALVLALGVLEDVGAVPGDRLEHAAVAPPQLVDWIARLDLAVVTQPSFVHHRGDDYLARVDQQDLVHLWPHRSLLDAGVRVACSSDAPYGEIDPWASMATAISRRSMSGQPVAAREAVTARQALDGYLGTPDRPGSAPRRIRRGQVADLALLDRPLAAVLADPSAVTVRGTWIDGRRVWGDS